MFWGEIEHSEISPCNQLLIANSVARCIEFTAPLRIEHLDIPEGKCLLSYLCVSELQGELPVNQLVKCFLYVPHKLSMFVFYWLHITIQVHPTHIQLGATASHVAGA